MHASKHIAGLILLSAATAAAMNRPIPPARAMSDSVAEFYRGKVITLNIGFSAGGGFDLYARTIANFMGRHIPGGPKIVPIQMPGAGSFRAAQFMSAGAPQDGTEIATIAQSVPLEQAFKAPGINFDARTFGWIGNPVSGVSTLLTWRASGIGTISEAQTRQVTIGSDGANVTSQYPLALNAMVGTKFKIVLGYPGGADINLAMERGEIDGEGQSEWSTLKSQESAWLRDRKVNLLVQIGLRKDPEISAYMRRDVPLMADLAKSADDRRALELLSSGEGYGRLIITTPHTPPARLAALRAAFDATMKDPEFLKSAKRLNMDVSPVGGEELQALTDRVLAAPPSIVQRLKMIVWR
jgi:tripartite-type tricarboxylate transporter receptor subunit TctC